MPDGSNKQDSLVRFHPLADLFPAMGKAEYAGLVADIRQNGLQTPIVKMADMIVDGRHRYKACRESGVEPRFVDYTGNDPMAYVIGANLHRRHLSVGQRSIVAGKLANMPQGARTDCGPSANLHKVSQSAAAKLLNVSLRSVADAKRVLDHGTPELVGRVERGELAVSAAAKVAEMPWDQQAERTKLHPQALRAAGNAAQGDQQEAALPAARQTISDRLLWGEQQAKLLRRLAVERGIHTQVDLWNVADAIEAPGKALRKELANSISSLLKCSIQLSLTASGRRGSRACRDTIDRELQRIELILTDVPSLQLTISAVIHAELAGSRAAALKALYARKSCILVVEDGQVLRVLPKVQTQDPYEVEMRASWAAHKIEAWTNKLGLSIARRAGKR